MLGVTCFVAVAIAHVSQCPLLHQGAHKAALGWGAPREELMEAILVAVEMRADGAFAHSALAIATFEEEQAGQN